MKTRLTCGLALSSSILSLTLNVVTILAQANHQSISEPTASILRGIDKPVVNEFQKAWRLSEAGNERMEVLVLLYRMRDHSLLASLRGLSGDIGEFRFAWNPTIIAVVHTHTNGVDPRPSSTDCRLADRFKIPVFTMTRRGMFVYDPFTRKTVEVQVNLDWLDLSKWQAVGPSLVKSR